MGINLTKLYMHKPERQTDCQIKVGTPDLAFINKKKRICQQADFDIPVDHQVKIKESKQLDKYGTSSPPNPQICMYSSLAM